MKVAVVGCGAVGSYYGAMLCRAGEDVHFLLRTDYEVVRRQGVSIRSPAGDFNVQPHCARIPQDIGTCDVVIVALKTTANAEFPNLLPPLVGPNTAIITLQNGLGNEEALAKLFPAEQIMGGLCFVCLNRIEPGLIQHTDHGLIVLGKYQRWPDARTEEIAYVVRQARIPCKITDDLACAHWEKLVWNIPFNGLGVAGAAGYDALVAQSSTFNAQLRPCLTTDQLLADPRWESLIRELMFEVIATANTLGLGVAETLVEDLIERTRTMGAYKASTLLDFELGRPLELESLFLQPLRFARQVGVFTPRLVELCKVLQQLNPT